EPARQDQAHQKYLTKCCAIRDNITFANVVNPSHPNVVLNTQNNRPSPPPPPKNKPIANLTKDNTKPPAARWV
ncbi:12791_t:CDS:1, partial [Funneliformis caledonium]